MIWTEYFKRHGPNLRSALDARTALFLHIEGHWPGANKVER
jgi:hypothetical protein